jgi:hypothetical protein
VISFLFRGIFEEEIYFLIDRFEKVFGVRIDITIVVQIENNLNNSQELYLELYLSICKVIT